MVAHYIADRDFAGMKQVIRSSVKLLMLMSLPVCLWLICEGDKFVSLLFERGKFSHADATLTGQLVVLLTPYILFSRLISIAQTPFYATKDTKMLVASMVLGFMLYALVAPPSFYLLGVYGFPLATSLAAALGTALMCLLIHRKFGPMEWARFRGFALRLGGSILVSCGGFAFGNRLSINDNFSGFWGRCLAAGIPSALGLIAFALGAFAFRLVEPGELAGQLRLPGWERLRRSAAARRLVSPNV
jgi:peptidoglycan biosynthesis protein MviN/MurJ (putative lipid II flippase)